MIHEITVENFKSVNEPTKLSFVVDRRFSKSNKNIQSTSGAMLSLAEAVIGANASGKTTLLYGLVSVKWLIVNSLEDRFPLGRIFQNFAGNKDNSPTKVSVTFENKGTVYDYRVSISGDRIVDERLDMQAKTNVRTTKKTLFERSWQKDEGYSIKSRSGFFSSNFEKMSDYSLKKISLLSIASFNGDSQPKEIVKYWKGLETNVELAHRFVPFGYEAHMALGRMSESAKFLEPFDRFDISIQGFNKKNGTFKHNFGDGYFELELEQESSGTQQFIVMIEKLEAVLKNGGIAVIDEFDAYLHPRMFNALIDQFFDKKKNRHGAQLLFSTHSHQILESLEKYQIVLVNKVNSVTSATRLDNSDYGKVRADDNYFIKYTRGEYGALPSID